ncbi:CAMK family protein kinase [Pelomyxa schiedti]|nr:CAMK family protein kinase [Pelomyxa schiedti]
MTHTRVGHAFLPFVHEGWSYQHPDSVNDTLLGEGGFGTVFLMRRRNGSVVENVAVKLIKRSRKPDKLVPADEDEFILMKKLDIGHPNLLPPLATLEIPLIDPTKRRLAIVTEHCALGNLETILKKGPYLPEYSKPALLKAITSGLVALHSRDISHRDIKLQNIVVTREGVPKICDLGLAKFSKSGVMDSNVGTEGYKPPEIYRGPYSGPLADVFSLAIVFIAVLTGHDFSCIKLGFDNEAFLMKKVQSQPKLSNFWKTVLQGMLTFDTSKRFSSAEVLKRIEAQYPMSRTVVFEQIPITPGPFDDWKSTTSWSSDSDSLVLKLFCILDVTMKPGTSS